LKTNQSLQLNKLKQIAKKAISQLENEGKKANLEKELIKIEREIMFKHQAELEGCTNPDLLLKALESNLNIGNMSFDCNFEAIVKDEVRRAKTAPETSLLFNYNESNQSYQTPSKTKAKNPFSKKYFNLTEQGQIIKNNPELAKRLKAEAEEE
jgi:hypothetical protein